MKTIPIRKTSLVALVDDEDFGRVSNHKWYLSSLGYVNAQFPGKPKRKVTLLHRFVMGAVPGQELDHIDRNKLNCQKYNLRFVNHSQNCQNRPVRRDNKTGHSGICFTRDGLKFRVYCSTKENKRFYAIRDTLEEAIELRNMKLEEMHGEYTATR